MKMPHHIITLVSLPHLKPQRLHGLFPVYLTLPPNLTLFPLPALQHLHQNLRTEAKK